MKKPLSQEVLKAIACLTMLLDHIGAVFYPDSFLRIVGRIAFPLYCFLLAEGAAHTHNSGQYGLRLAIGALLSELPFDLLFFGCITWRHQNVMLTLLLGFVALRVLSGKRNTVLKLAAVIALAAMAELLHTDYGWAGVLLICLFGISREYHYKLLVQLLGMSLLFAIMGGRQIYGLLALIPIALYSGRKASRSKPLQWAYYLFYPAHMLLILIMK